MPDSKPYKEISIPSKEKRELLSSLVKAESMIRNHRGQETVVVFCDALGVFARRAEGYTVRLYDVFRSFEGCIFTHNHPSGHSFSPEDVGTACAGKMQELRAVSTQYTYQLRPKARGWSEEYWRERLEPLHNQILEEVFIEFLALEDRGFQSRAESNLLVQHEVWSRIAEIGEIEYNRIEVK